MIGGIDIVGLIIYLIVIGGVCGLLWWLIGFAGSKGLPEPFVKFGQIAIAVIAVLALINLLLSLVGHSFAPINFSRR
jgi:hypothetical protein